MTEYIERENLLDGISSPESDFDEVITNLIFEHKLDFLHDNNEDGVRDFAIDLIVRVKNYIATEPAADVVEVKHGEWIAVPSSDMSTGKAYKCSECQKMRYGVRLPPYCQECGADMRKGGVQNDRK